MPELPEVETIANQLQKVLAGKVLQSIEVKNPKSWSGEIETFVQSSITSVSRAAKVLRIQFSNNQSVLVHLKMSGQLIYVSGDKRVGGGHPTSDWIQELPSKHTRVIFSFTDQTTLFFNDQRMFGWMRAKSDEEVESLFSSFSPDIIHSSMTVPYLLEKAKTRSVSIKQFIMDNAIVSGVGNIYANDALNLAKISPFRSARSLSEAEMSHLYQAMVEVIQLGISLGGATSDQKYVHVNGMGGKYQDVMRVYQKSGQPCPNCGGTIESARIGGRGTFYCPSCQK